jgi:Tfp pilus assembly pilus retraction ATPase PilT
MSLMPSLCAALERANGQRLVMRAGERPHVLTGDRRHDVASAVLSVNAVEALVDQILSSESRRILSERGSVEETLTTPAFPHPLTAKAERVGDDFCVELIVRFPEAAPAPAPEPEPIPAPVEVEMAASDVTVEETSAQPEPPADEPPPYVEEVAAVPSQPVYVQPTPFVPSPSPVVEAQPHVVAPVVVHPPVRVVTRLEERLATSRPTLMNRTDLHGLIASAFERGATTLFLRSGAPPAARINDRIVAIGDGVVASSVFDEVSSFTSRGGDGQWRSLSDGEWARDHEDFGHVTCREFSDDQGHGLVVHLRPRPSPKLLHKYIPRQVRTACEGDGLIIVSAQSDADVDSFAGAIADWSGRRHGGYLISLHRRSGRAEITGAFVSQRTINGSDADFAGAIRRASHEGPDILLIAGPQTDLVLHEAILAASAGRLVIVAVVAPTAVTALRTTLGHSGLDRDAHVRRVLASSFRVAVGYRNVRRIGGGRMLVQDLVTTSKEIRTLIEMADFDGLTRLQQQGAPGTRTVDEALARASRRGQVSLREAVAHADDRSRLVALVRTRTHASLAGRGNARPDHEVHVPIAVAQ